MSYERRFKPIRRKVNPLVDIDTSAGSPGQVLQIDANGNLVWVDCDCGGSPPAETDLVFREAGPIAHDPSVAANDPFNITIPTGSETGDLLVGIVCLNAVNESQDLWLTPTGWTAAVDGRGHGNKSFGRNPYVHVFTRISDGTEGANLTVTRTATGSDYRAWGQVLAFDNPNTTDDFPFQPTANVYAGAAEDQVVGAGATFGRTNVNVYRAPPHRFAGSGLTLGITAWGSTDNSFTWPAVADAMGASLSDTIRTDDVREGDSDDPLKVVIREIDHIDGAGETYTNLLANNADGAQRAWDASVGPATGSPGWTTSLVTIFDADTVSGYEERAYVMVDAAGTGRHGVTKTIDVTTGEDYYIYFEVACRNDTGQSFANQVTCGILTIDDGTDEFGQGFYLHTNAAGTGVLANVAGSPFAGGFAEAHTMPGNGKTTHLFVRYTAAVTGTVTLGFYQSNLASGEAVLSRAALPANTGAAADEFIENGIELIHASVSTGGWVNPRDWRREDMIRLGDGDPTSGSGFTGDTGASLPASEDIILPRVFTFASNVPYAEVGHTHVWITLRNNTEDVDPSPSAWLSGHCQQAHWQDSTETGNGPPHVLVVPRFTAEGPSGHEHITKLALPRNSGKWYWEVRVNGNFGFVSTSPSGTPDMWIGLAEASFCGKVGLTPLNNRVGTWGILPSGFAFQGNNNTAITFPHPDGSGDLSNPRWLGFAWDADAGTMTIYQGDNSNNGTISLGGLPGGGLLAGGGYVVGRFYVPFVANTTPYYRWQLQTNRANGDGSGSGVFDTGSFLEATGGTIPAGFTFIGAGAPEDDGNPV
jgi:hypothetical protein